MGWQALDFLQGSSNFKSHRKSKQKESVPAAAPHALSSTNKPSKSALIMVEEEKRREASGSSGNLDNDYFPDFDDP